MNKAHNGLQRRKGLLDNYRSLAIVTALLIISFSSHAQNIVGSLVTPYDSSTTSKIQAISGTGYGWNRAWIKYGLTIPRDTVKMAVKDSASIAFKSGKFYIWNGYSWVSPGGSSGSTGNADSLGGLPANRYVKYTDTSTMLQRYRDTLTAHNLNIGALSTSLAAKRNVSDTTALTGTATNFSVSKTYTGKALNFDGSKEIYYHNGTAIDSFAKAILHIGPGLSYTHITAGEDSLAATGGGGGGGSGISKVGSPAYGLTRVNDSTYIADTSVTAKLRDAKLNQITDSIAAHNNEIGANTTNILANTTSINNRYDSLRRLPGSTQVEGRKNGIWYPAFTDSTGGIINAAQLSAQRDTIQKNFVNAGISLTSNWVGDGNSIMAGASATSSPFWFVNLLATATGTTVTNRSVGGSGIRDIIYRQFTTDSAYLNPKSLVIEVGTNEPRSSTSAYTYNKIFKGLQTVIANQFLDTIVPIASSSITKAGTWTNLTALNTKGKSELKLSSVPIKSSVAGSTLTFNFFGNVLVLGTWGVDASHTGYGRYSVTDNGVNVGTFDMKGNANDWYYASINTFDERMPNVNLIQLSSGKHNIVVTTLDNLEVDFDYIGRLANPAKVASMIVGHVMYSNQTGYNLGSSFSSSLKVDTVNRYIDSAVKFFINLSYPINVAKVENYVDTLTALLSPTTDGLHPNNTGHYQLFQAYNSLVKQVGSGGAGGSYINNSTASQTGNYNITGIGKQQQGAIVGQEPAAAYVTNGAAQFLVNANGGNGTKDVLLGFGQKGIELFDSTNLKTALQMQATDVDSSVHFKGYYNGGGPTDFLKFNGGTKVTTFNEVATFLKSVTVKGGITSTGTLSINIPTTASGLNIDNTTNQYSTASMSFSGTQTMSFGSAGSSALSPFTSLNFINSLGRDFIFANGGTTELWRIKGSGVIVIPAVNTATGTTGAQTINKAAGKVNFAAAASSLVVTNSFVTTASIVHVQVEGNDATAKTATVTLAAGSFTITLNAAATAETKVSFTVIN